MVCYLLQKPFLLVQAKTIKAMTHRVVICQGAQESENQGFLRCGFFSCRFSWVGLG
jgi:hypothetical protein